MDQTHLVVGKVQLRYWRYAVSVIDCFGEPELRGGYGLALARFARGTEGTEKS